MSSVVLWAAYGGAAFFPVTARRLLKIRLQQTAGAAAWLAQAYIQLSRLSNQAKDQERVSSWLQELKQLRVSGVRDVAWGLPFDWQSLVLLPANTPLLYPTWQAAQAFYDYYCLTGDSASLEVAVCACRGMTKIFNKAVDTPSHLCLTYSPRDLMQVYNINALAGGLCCQVGATTGDEMIADSGRRLLSWVVDGQQEDGSWEYFSKEMTEGDPCIDHFHTAMTLLGLLKGLEIVGVESWNHAVRLGLSFYLLKLFDKKDRPKYYPSKVFPIDVMSCAEGIILLSNIRLSSPNLIGTELHAAATKKLEALVTWSCRNLQNENGYFYYRKYSLFKVTLFSYRWGQGAMLKALASYLNASK